MMNRSTNTRKRSTTIMYVALVILAVVAAYLLLSESDVDTANQPYDPAVLALFSDNYAEARIKFLDAATAASARLQSFEHPVVGPAGESLFTDVALIGPQDAGAVLFVGSGTHGVEGFAGSAIQTGLLRNSGELAASDIRLVLVHAINPFGFAHLRRANEDNVDLNRNFRDHGKPPPLNDGYDALADAISPNTLSLISDVAALSRLLFYAAKKGTGAARAAVTSGQYRHPCGLFYGGRSDTWSAETLRTIVRRHGGGARRLAFIDVHTGLGPYKSAEIILNAPKATALYRRAEAWWGEIVKTTTSGESVSTDLAASLKLAIPGLLPDAAVTAVSLEFGTVPTLKALRALRAENWLYHHAGANHPDAGRIKDGLLQAFYPDADDWRTAVWMQGKDTADKAVRGLSRQGRLGG